MSNGVKIKPFVYKADVLRDQTFYDEFITSVLGDTVQEHKADHGFKQTL
jgi:hypothetical protein